MKFAFVAKHRVIWPVAWMCSALDVSRSGFHAWLTRRACRRAQDDAAILAKVRASFAASDRTYGARRIWHDVLAGGVACGLHRIERLMRITGRRGGIETTYNRAWSAGAGTGALGAALALMP